MNIFDVDADVEVQEVADFSGKRTVDTNEYEATIKLAYLSTAKTGSTMLNLIYTMGGQEVTLKPNYLFNGAKKHYIDKKTGAKKQNIGIAQLSELCMVAIGKNSTVEDKTIKIWDYDLKAEAPVKRPVLVDLLGAKVLLAVQEIQEAKHNDASQAVMLNEVVKACDVETRQTLAEKNAGKDAVWLDKWTKKNAGVLNDKFVKPEGDDLDVIEEDDDLDDDDLFNNDED